MCGIVGLFLKDRALEPQLGGLLAAMLEVMTDRGPDSAGFAVYGEGRPDRIKLTLRGEPRRFGEGRFGRARRAGSGPCCATPMWSCRAGERAEAALRTWLASPAARHLTVIGAGQRMELYKEVGLPADVSERFGLAGMAGTHGIGHTRMATESAVTTDGAHPFSTGADQCLVHNGSLSNHRSLRRMLEPRRDDLRHRQRHRGGRRLSELASCARARAWPRRLRTASAISTASTPSSSAPRTASPCCATRSPASRR